MVSESGMAGWQKGCNCGERGIGRGNVVVPLRSFARMNDCCGVATFVILGVCRKYLGGCYCVTLNGH